MIDLTSISWEVVFGFLGLIASLLSVGFKVRSSFQALLATTRDGFLSNEAAIRKLGVQLDAHAERLVSLERLPKGHVIDRLADRIARLEEQLHISRRADHRSDDD